MKNMRNLLLGTVAAVFWTAAAYAAPPSGVWNIHENGNQGRLVLNFTSDFQLQNPSSLNGDPIRGFWTESSQRLVFYRVVGSGNVGAPPTNLQVFEGYQFPGSLAGSFDAFSTAGGTSTRNVFGWYATTP